MQPWYHIVGILTFLNYSRCPFYLSLVGEQKWFRTSTIMLILLNLRSIINLVQRTCGFFDAVIKWSAGIWCGLTGNFVDDGTTLAATPRQPSEMCAPPPIRQTPQPDAVVGEPEDNDDTLHFRYYVGPALFCTQPMPPPASAIIAANFSYPPPPLPEYYIGPTVFDIMGPPPLACCVVASRFCYPPPPPPCPGQGRTGLCNRLALASEAPLSV
eukprot:XP_016661589.1 PREDICTED: uncharacterized protein LOC100569980 isoform X2 [Acyrthosiphon pisum]